MKFYLVIFIKFRHDSSIMQKIATSSFLLRRLLKGTNSPPKMIPRKQKAGFFHRQTDGRTDNSSNKIPKKIKPEKKTAIRDTGGNGYG